VGWKLNATATMRAGHIEKLTVHVLDN
jgi:hypothetical protein